MGICLVFYSIILFYIEMDIKIMYVNRHLICMSWLCFSANQQATAVFIAVLYHSKTHHESMFAGR